MESGGGAAAPAEQRNVSPMEFLYRRLKGMVVVVAALFLASLFTITLSDAWSGWMPAVAVGLLILLIIVLMMAFFVGEEAGVPEGTAHFAHHDVMPDFVLDEEDQEAAFGGVAEPPCAAEDEVARDDNDADATGDDEQRWDDDLPWRR